MADDNQKSDSLKEIPASEILAKIHKGEPVEYDRIRVTGNLEINRLDMPTHRIERTDFQKKMLGLTDETKLVKSRIRITNSTIEDNLFFGSVVFQERVDCSGSQFCFAAYFMGSLFLGDANFEESQFRWDAQFSGTQFNRDANFRGSQFSINPEILTRFPLSGMEAAEDIESPNATHVNFIGSMFCGIADFRRALFRVNTSFEESEFGGFADFRGSRFTQNTYYFMGSLFKKGADFRNSFFKGNIDFLGSRFDGDNLTFRDAMFINPRSQEEACRRAKNVLVKAGNRDEEEYHFYREMEAKRIRKGIRENSGLGLSYLLLKTDTWPFWKFFFYDVLEWFFVQKIFGYGVHPFRLFGWWLAFVVIFAVIYSIKGAIEQPDVRQWYDYLWFSIATAATPGYALYKPLGLFKIIAGVEAILGTFMWAAFITTFARKFSR